MSYRRTFLALVLLVLPGCVGTTSHRILAPPSGDVCEQPVADSPTFYEDNPTYLAPLAEKIWPSRSPESQGLSATALEEGVRKLESLPQALSFLVLRHGNLVLERYFHGNRPDYSNNIHSASKSILSGLIGIALREHFIKGVDQTLGELLPPRFSISEEKKRITVQNLLTMSAGFSWTEDSTEGTIEIQTDWVQGILDLPLLRPPGEKFSYDTGVTHLLSAILTESTGMSTCQFARDYLFDPMEISIEHWGRDPQEYFSGGYNLYMAPRQLLKLGQLYLQDGSWNGDSLIPAEWARTARQPHLLAHDQYSYGYLFFLLSENGRPVQKMWGYGGQFAYIVPSLDLVVVLTADTQQEYTDLDGDDFLARYVLATAKQ